MNGRSKRVGVYISEEQDIYTAMYRSVFSEADGINLLGVSENGEFTEIDHQLRQIRPDVLLYGVEVLTKDKLRWLLRLGLDFPMLSLCLLLTENEPGSLMLLRKLLETADAGLSVFYKNSIRDSGWLRSIMHSLKNGCQLVDPDIHEDMARLHQNEYITGLTSREQEILTLMARGYTNRAIAEKLYIDVKTVRHHINNMYSKLKAEHDFTSRHQRVSATLLYLKSVGRLVSG